MLHLKLFIFVGKILYIFEKGCFRNGKTAEEPPWKSAICFLKTVFVRIRNLNSYDIDQLSNYLPVWWYSSAYAARGQFYKYKQHNYLTPKQLCIPIKGFCFVIKKRKPCQTFTKSWFLCIPRNRNVFCWYQIMLHITYRTVHRNSVHVD